MLENERHRTHFDSKCGNSQVMTSISSKPSVEVMADLRCELDGRPVIIFTEGDAIVVEVERIGDVVRLLRLLGAGESLRKHAKRLATLLNDFDLKIESRVSGRVVGLIGFDVESYFWRLLGVPNVQLKPLAIVANAVRPS